MRWVMVLDPDYKGKLHALTLSLTPRKIILDKVVNALFESNEPAEVYIPKIQSIAAEYDSYRTYFLKNMRSIRRVPYYLTDKPY